MEILIVRNNHTILNWERKSSIVKYEECMSNDKIEKLSSKLCKNKRMKKFMVTCLGLAFYFKSAFAVGVGGKGIDSLGWTMLNLIRHWAYWILLVYCIISVIKAGINGEAKSTLPIVMKFVIIFASMYLIPAIFDAIVGAF